MADTGEVATSVCTTAEKYCVSELQQYQNFTECFDCLKKKTCLGEAYELGLLYCGSSDLSGSFSTNRYTDMCFKP